MTPRNTRRDVAVAQDGKGASMRPWHDATEYNVEWALLVALELLQ